MYQTFPVSPKHWEHIPRISSYLNKSTGWAEIRMWVFICVPLKASDVTSSNHDNAQKNKNTRERTDIPVTLQFISELNA